MYFSSGEHRVYDKGGGFICSLVFIVKNKSETEVDHKGFNESVRFTISFLTNNFLLSLFRNCRSEVEINNFIISSHEEEISSCKRLDLGLDFYSAISLDSLNEESLRNVLNSDRSQMIQNMNYFLENIGNIMRYYNIMTNRSFYKKENCQQKIQNKYNKKLFFYKR